MRQILVEGLMILVAELTQRYGIRPILKQMNLHVPAGSPAAIIGPNAIGKSTLLAGRPAAGVIEVVRRVSIAVAIENLTLIAECAEEAELRLVRAESLHSCILSRE